MKTLFFFDEEKGRLYTHVNQNKYFSCHMATCIGANEITGNATVSLLPCKILPLHLGHTFLG